MAIDEVAWPLVRVRWSGHGTDKEQAEFLARLDVWLERRERFGVLIDARGALGLNSELRRRTVAEMEARKAQAAPYLVQAVVHDNAIQRTLVLVMETVVPPAFPSKAFGDVDDALAWLCSELADAR